MRIVFVLILLLSISNITGCITSSTPPPQKSGEPVKPLIMGFVSGVPDNTLVTIHVRTSSGWEPLYVTRLGNGLWEGVLTPASIADYGPDFLVTAETEEYISQPDSYMIRVVGDKAYVVENGEIGEEALHLDFVFTPAE